MRKHLRKHFLTIASALVTFGSISVAAVPVSAATETPVGVLSPRSTSVTHGETGLSKGQSSASTNRIHSSGRYRVHIVVYKGNNLTAKVFRYGSQVHSFKVTKGNNVKYFNGTGDYSVRVYNNSKKNAVVGVDINAV